MKALINFFVLIIIFVTMNFAGLVYAQDCTDTTVGLPPINDLGTGIYRTFQGGLYPGGSNSRPTIHNNAGLSFGNFMVPLDTAGNFNASTGRIVLISIGMSNCALEFQEFITTVSGDIMLNPKVSLINGAQGGQTIDSVNNPSGNFWTVVNSRLATAGLTRKQVQVVWFKEAEASPHDTTFPGYPISLKNKFKTAMGILKTKFVNIKQCYLASRIYAGYATSALNPEPYAYRSGWSVKWLIEDQINGDTNLVYNGTTPNAPWLSWGPYLWADGTIPRSDGLIWKCPDDFVADGTHLSTTGQHKIALKLINFFKTDATTKPWFVKNTVIYLTCGFQGLLHVPGNYLNFRDTVVAYLRTTSFPFTKIDSAVTVLDSLNLTGPLHFYNASSGNYYIHVKHRNSIETWSRQGGQMIVAGGLYSYDFTAGANRAFGNNLILKGTKYCIYSGDVDQDGAIDGSDLSAADNAAANFATGYIPTDVNGDFISDASDLSIIDNNAFNSIVKITP